MKKIFVCFIISILLLNINTFVYAEGIWGSVCVFDESGDIQRGNDLSISIGFLDESTFRFSSYNNLKLWKQLEDNTKSLILSNSKGDYLTVFELKYGNIDDPEETGALKVRLNAPIVDGGRTHLMGKNYRVYFLKDGVLEEIEIKDSDKESVEFETEQLGVYVLYYNPNVYEVKFYEKYPEDGVEPFYVNDNLEENDIVKFPEIPTKEGYVFTGWKQEDLQGRYSTYLYITAYNLTALDLWRVYASWCAVDEYTPLVVKLESEGQIIKGNENGSTITLSLSEGKFDEEINENVENDWKIVGNDNLSVSSVERLDDTTAKLTLSGNSSDVYTESAIQIEFNSGLYISHEDFGDNWDVNEIADIQLDENGVKKAMFISDNAVTLNAQAYSGGGGGSWRVSKYTVKFNSNGGEDIGSVRVEKNECVEEPEPPSRDGYVFKGWYSDAELTQKYDFSTEITSGLTLYAAWEEDAPKQIILTVGEKGANIFGKEIENDVAPVIKNDRVMVPIRFVAESLGAEVVWNKENPKEVKITKEDIEIVIYIGEDYAFVNGEKVKLDSSAFLENDRTYIPIRFVSERMDSDVDWEQETQKVIITLK